MNTESINARSGATGLGYRIALNKQSILRALLFITSVCLFTPFLPLMPQAGLDPSWQFGMNQVVAQGLAIGRDIVFTFGPYASIYTQIYHPATDSLMLWGGLYLGLSYGFAILLLTQNARFSGSLLLLAVLACLMFSRDALLFSYPLLAGLLSIRLLEPRAAGAEKPPALLQIIVFFLPFGLLPLIKGSFLLLCAAIAALVLAAFLLSRRWHQAVAVLAAPLISTIVFWAASGQSLTTLPLYFVSMQPIISGYTGAMALWGFTHEIIVYLLISGLLTWGVIRQSMTISRRLLLVTMMALYAFVVFKAGYVRHDNHAIIAANAILLASALLLAFAQASGWRSGLFSYCIVLGATLLAGTLVTYNVSTQAIKEGLEAKGLDLDALRLKSRYEQLSVAVHHLDLGKVLSGFSGSLKPALPYGEAWQGIKTRSSDTDELDSRYQATVQTLRHQAKLPVLPGSTDIYPSEITSLLVSGNHWNPRPIFQSYSAYTPALAQLNAEHLLGPNAPDNIVLGVETIDGRLPALDDGASWPVLINQYQPAAVYAKHLVLRRGEKAACPDETLPLSSARFNLGETVELPKSAAPVFAKINIQPSLMGKLANLLFKSSPLTISLHFENGQTRTYRYIASMAQAGFIISPLIESASDFQTLYSPTAISDEAAVRAFTINTASNLGLWNKQGEVAFEQIVTPANQCKVSQ